MKKTRLSINTQDPERQIKHRTQIQRLNKLACHFRFTLKLLVGGKCLCYDTIDGGAIVNSLYND